MRDTSSDESSSDGEEEEEDDDKGCGERQAETGTDNHGLSVFSIRIGRLYSRDKKDWLSSKFQPEKIMNDVEFVS